MKRHTLDLTIPFGDVDAAGMVYYPRVFHYFHLAYERFLIEVVGRSLPAMIAADQGAPILKATAQYQAPLRLDMRVQIACWVRRLGGSSWDWAFEINDAETERLCVVGELTLVMVQLSTMNSQQIDADVRAAVQPYLELHAP